MLMLNYYFQISSQKVVEFALLCRSCDKTLTNILELEERLSHMKEKVKSFISSFKSLIQESRERTATAKRTVPSSLCNASSPKRICLDPTQQNTFQSSSPAVKVVALDRIYYLYFIFCYVSFCIYICRNTLYRLK